MEKLVFFISAGITILTIISLACVPLVLHMRHKQRMCKYMSKIRKAFDGVSLNEKERLLLQAYFEAMECIGLQDEVTADWEKSNDEKLQKTLDALRAIRE